MSDYTSTARALALPPDDDPPLSASRRSTSATPWRRRSLSASHVSTRPYTTKDRWLRTATHYTTTAQRAFLALPLWQQACLILLSAVLAVLSLLFLIYNHRIFAALEPAARKWRALPAGWLILWIMTFFVSFPPMIGYSTCVTIAGFVFGLRGWFIIASATILGSTASFLASRTLLRDFVSRLTARNAKFQALSLVLKHDGLKLLVMIRLCPLPYSISNGAISTIPTVTWTNFMLATALATPKLLLHVFVGRQIGLLAEDGNEMSVGTRVVSYVSIVIGLVAGVATGYFIYVKTRARAVELEAEEAAVGGRGPRLSSEDRPTYADDLDDAEDGRHGRRGNDDMSLHTTYADEDVDADAVYRDDFLTDDEDARERDVFDVGDGSVTGDEEEGGKRGER